MSMVTCAVLAQKDADAKTSEIIQVKPLLDVAGQVRPGCCTSVLHALI